MTTYLPLLALFLVVPSAAFPQWVVETRTDSMTDEVIKEATVHGESGHILKVVRTEPDGPVLGVFKLAENSPEAHQEFEWVSEAG